jgi:hypothetical protein
MKTTFEMDGLLTPEDIARRHYGWIQCINCSKWTHIDFRAKARVCAECQGTSFDLQSITSERTFDPIRAAKRKIITKKGKR